MPADSPLKQAVRVAAAQALAPKGREAQESTEARRAIIRPVGEGAPAALEQYNIARTKIIQHPEAPQVILVSSPGSGDGKTHTALNLAASFAGGGDWRILLVSTEAHQEPTSPLQCPACPGLADALADPSCLEAALWEVEGWPMMVLPCGGSDKRLGEFDPIRWQLLADRIRRFDYVIIDAPPVGLVAEYYLLEAIADAVLIVARPDHTNRKRLRQALNQVPKKKLLGVLLNGVDHWSLKDRAYYLARSEAQKGSRP